MNNKVKIAILQRICPTYRVPLFKRLTNLNEYSVKLFIGDDIPNSKVKSAANLDGVNYSKLKTKFLKLGSRVLPLHVNLISSLRSYKPDVILCEAESHFLGYVMAILYKKLFNRKVKLMYWCFIDIPGKSDDPSSLNTKLKQYFRHYFQAFVLYSSYGKKTLFDQGYTNNQIFVATNVGDVEAYLKKYKTMNVNTQEARKQLKLPDAFTVLYVGTLDENKRPDVMIALANIFKKDSINFVVLGKGPMFESLQQRIKEENLNNVFLKGHVSTDLHLYYKASSVLLIPGRGGIIISEAMAFGLPAIVHEADGTEYDLIEHNVNGFIIKDGSVEGFANAISHLKNLSNTEIEHIKLENEKRIETKFNTSNMIQSILNAANYCVNQPK